jgi:GNAT superfamily N-acetyltransferase
MEEIRIEIKRVTIEDFEKVIKIYHDVAKNMQSNGIFQWNESYPSEGILRNDILSGHMYAGIINTEMASLFVLNKTCEDDYLRANWSYSGNNFIVIHRFCVKVEYQNRGIGIKTMGAIEGYIRELGIESIRIDTFSKNLFSLKLFNSLSYNRVGEADWDRGIFFIFEKILTSNNA